MKKLLLLTIGAGLSFGAFAQRPSSKNFPSKSATLSPSALSNSLSTARTTAIGSSETLTNIDTLDPVLYYAGATSDTGFVSGTDFYGDKGFAERYDINGSDSSVVVTGVISVFGGVISPTSTKSVVFNVWSMGAPVPTGGSYVTGDTSSFWFESGFPNTVLASATVPLTGIFIDSFQTTTFSTPSSSINTSFFVGYTINYDPTALAGDTIGLYSTPNGYRSQPLFLLAGTDDTLVNNLNVTEYSDGTWNDNATSNFQYEYDYFIFPIVTIGNPTGVASVTKNDLTFFGNYPNPAVNATNIKFSLAATTDVTITITDLAGHVINIINETSLSAGEHIIPVTTTNMAAGNYLYVLHTATGAGIASKLTVIK